MSIWPRRPSVTGQDQEYFPHDPSTDPPSIPSKEAKARLDAERFKAALIKQSGGKAALAYIRRSARKKTLDQT